jgi:hypothetical protein
VVDRQHLIFISSCHTTKIHTLSVTTFSLTRSFRGFVHSRNCVDPEGRVLSHLLTLFLRSSRLMWKKREERPYGDRRAICNTTRGIDVGRGVIRLWVVSDGTDVARPL